MFQNPMETEEVVLLTDEEIPDADESFSTNEEFSFASFLILITHLIQQHCRCNYRSLRHLHQSIYSQIVAIIILFSLVTIAGIVFVTHCPTNKFPGVFLIVHGCFAAFVISFYLLINYVKPNNSNWTFNSGDGIIKYLLFIVHCLNLLAVSWFLLGQFWMLWEISNIDHREKCHSNSVRFTIFIFIVQYISALCYLSIRIWNVPSVFQCLLKLSQKQLEKFPHKAFRRLSILENENPTNEECSADFSPESTIEFSTQAEKANAIILIMAFVFSFVFLTVMITLFAYLTVAAARITIEQKTPLPTHCSNYITKSEPTRHHSHGSDCCENDNSLNAGWYRFAGSGGTQLLMKPTAATGLCGTSCPGWWNGTLPKRIGDTTLGSVLFGNGYPCTGSVYPILATKCVEFYVFYLSPTPSYSSYRYCTMNSTD